jgi:hypothetical protein
MARRPGASRRTAAALVGAVLQVCVPGIRAQPPVASLTGIVRDSRSQPVAGVRLTVKHIDTGWNAQALTDGAGRYSFAALPAGNYDIGASKENYQSRKHQSVVLAVGAKAELDFWLAAVDDVGGQVSVLLGGLPGPGLPPDTVASSVSVVVDESKILQLPLATRNIYSLFVLQPGVTSQGAVVRRGLTFSVHGQRVSASNYLLDGIDNNNIVLTGPAAAVSADATQEFRMINSSFSAEYGRAAGFVAHVATHAGGNQFHGRLFEFFSHEKLNANTFENNSQDLPRSALRHNQFGYFLGGPLSKNRTFFSSAMEFSFLRYRTPLEVSVPSPAFIARLPENSVARRLLSEIPPLSAAVPSSTIPDIAEAQYQAFNRIDTFLTTQRADHHTRSGNDRFVARYTLAATREEHEVQFDRGYPSLRPEDTFRAHNTMIGWTRLFSGGPVNDVRFGWSRERVALPRPRPDIPFLQLAATTFGLGGNFRQASTNENNNVLAFSDNLSLRRGRMSVRAGFEFRRNLSNRATVGLENEAPGATLRYPHGYFNFLSLQEFALGRFALFAISVDRFSSGALRLPDLRREYRSNEFAWYVQNDVKMHRRLSVNFGLRYEYYGVPHNRDRSKDVNFYFGPGNTIEERIAGGTLRATTENPGDLKGLLYRRDWLNFAPSVGIAWDAFGSGRTVVRAGYAIAFDRIFETLRDLSSNSHQLVRCLPPACAVEFRLPVEQMLSSLPQQLPEGIVVQLDEGLRTPYAQNWYAGIQHSLTANTLLEIGHAGSTGRKLISRDEVNRNVPGTGRFNPRILNDTFLSNAGNSNYVGLEATIRRRFSRGLQFQASYTFSHAIDNQSDLLEGVRYGPDWGHVAVSRFTRQLDARVDRGNAAFDQRHNLIVNAIWDVPARGRIFGGWTLSVIGGHRSGFPVTVLGSVQGAGASAHLLNNRVDYIGAEGQEFSPAPVAGGVQWLDPSLFRPAAPGSVGTLGRNALAGPGFWNYDFAVLRTVAVTERFRVQFRGEFYNGLNHANLSIPFTLFPQNIRNPGDFSKAFYGLNRSFSRFGDLPLDHPARRIQFGLRLTF